MANPTGADATFEYFEVYNTGASVINVSDLTISDDDSDSFSFAGSSAVIGVGDFFVFGASNFPDVDISWEGSSNFVLANGGDEIVISDTSGEISRVNYSDGDEFGEGVATVLNDIANATGGITSEDDYVAEVVDNDTLSTGDIGSPGSAGGTAVPEPTISVLATFAGCALLFRRRRS